VTRISILSWYQAGRTDSGDRGRLTRLSHRLAEEFDVRVISFAPPDAACDPHILEQRIIPVRNAVPYRVSRPRVLRATVTGESVYERLLAGHRAIRAFARDEIRAASPDLIIVNQLPPWPLVPCDLRGRAIVDTQNAEAPRLRRMRSLADSGVKRAVLSAQATAAESFERQLSQRAVMVWAVSSDDAGYFSTLGATVRVVPNGVPDHLFDSGEGCVAPDRAVGEVRLLFVGSLGYRANVDAIHWYAASWARQADNRAVLDVVGSGDPRGVERVVRANPTMRMVGPVEDIGQSYASHDALVVPLRMGGGSRLKVLEAAAVGLPIISTPVGVEGTGLIPWRHYAPILSPDEWGEMLRRLRAEPKLFRSLASSAREFVRSYAWKTVGQQAVDAVKEARMMRRGRGSRG
jgi:glycosyltransferase involved in cell wall biosynthesis